MNDYKEDIKNIQKTISKLFQDLSEEGHGNVWLEDAAQNMFVAHTRLYELQQKIEKQKATLKK